MTGDDFLRQFNRAKKDQMQGRKMGEFSPVSEAIILKSNQLFDTDCRSLMLQIRLDAARSYAVPIIQLHASARASFLFECENPYSHIGPSEVFNNVSETLLELLDITVADTPTDILILCPFGMVWRHQDSQTVEAVLKEVDECESNEHYHSLVRYEARLLRSHFSKLDKVGFLIFRRSLLLLRSIGLFTDECVSPLALDLFPSLAPRESELIERRKALEWRPETPDDRVIAL